MRCHVEAAGDWQIGPGAHAAIVSVAGPVDTGTVRARLAPVHALAHLAVETQPS